MRAQKSREGFYGRFFRREAGSNEANRVGVRRERCLQDGAGITPYFTNVKCRRGDATLTDAEYTFLQGDHIQSATKK